MVDEVVVDAGTAASLKNSKKTAAAMLVATERKKNTSSIQYVVATKKVIVLEKDERGVFIVPDLTFTPEENTDIELRFNHKTVGTLTVRQGKMLLDAPLSNDAAIQLGLCNNVTRLKVRTQGSVLLNEALQVKKIKIEAKEVACMQDLDVNTLMRFNCQKVEVGAKINSTGKSEIKAGSLLNFGNIDLAEQTKVELEDLQCAAQSHFNFGMSQKQASLTTEPYKTTQCQVRINGRLIVENEAEVVGRGAEFETKTNELLGSMKLENTTWKTDQVEQAGKLSLGKFSYLFANHLQSTQTSKSDFGQSVVEVGQMDMSGNYQFTNAQFITNRVHLHGEANFDHVSVESEDFNVWGKARFYNNSELKGISLWVGGFLQAVISSLKMKFIGESSKGEWQLTDCDVTGSDMIMNRGKQTYNDTSVSTPGFLHMKGKVNFNSVKPGKDKIGLLNAQDEIEIQDSKLKVGITNLADKAKVIDTTLDSDHVNITGEANIDRSTVKTQTLHIAENAEATVTRSDMNTDTSVVDKKAKLDVVNSALAAKKQLFNEGSLTLKTELPKSAPAAPGLDKPTTVKAGSLYSAGNMAAKAADMEVDKNFILTEEANTTLEQLRVKMGDAKISGAVDLKNVELSSASNMHTIDAKIKSHRAVLAATETLKIHESTTISGTSLKLKAKDLVNEGLITLEEQFNAEVERFLNSGKIDGGKSAIVEANQFFINMLGHIGAANTNIKAAGLSLNLFGDIEGKDCLMIQSLLAANLGGLQRSWNTIINSGLNLNAGIIAPLVMPTTWASLFEPQRLLTITRSILTNLFPGKAAIVGSAFSAASAGLFLYRNISPTVRTNFSAYRNSNLGLGGFAKKKLFDAMEGLRSTRPCDVLPAAFSALGLAKNTLNFANSASAVYSQMDFSTFSSTDFHSAYDYVPHFNSDTLKNMGHSFRDFAAATDKSHLAKDFATTTATFFMPTYTAQSLADFNLGEELSGTNMNNTFYSNNAGVKGAAMSLNESSNDVDNNGVYFSIFGATSITGDRLKGSGAILAPNGLNLAFQEIDVGAGGKHQTNHANVQTKKLNVSGQVKYEGGRVASEETHVAPTGEMKINHAQATLGKLTNEGHSAFSDSAVTTGTTDNTGQMEVSKSHYKADAIQNNNKLSVDESQVDAKSVENKTGEAHVHKSVISASEKIVSSAPLTMTDAKAESPQVTLSNSTTLDNTTVEGKEQVTISDAATLNTTHVKGGKVVLDGDVDMKKSTVEAKEELINKKRLAADESVATGKNVTNEGEANLKNKSLLAAQEKLLSTGDLGLQDSRAEGKQVEVRGHVDGKDSAIVGDQVGLAANGKLDNVVVSGKEKVTIEESTHLATHQTIVQSEGEIDHQGHLTASGLLAMKAKHIHTSNNSEVIQDQTSKSDEDALLVQADSADMHGKTNVDTAIIDVKHLPNAGQLVSQTGQYAEMKVNKILTLKTEEEINIDQNILRQCGFNVTGSGIHLQTNYQTDFDVTFKSTTGDVLLDGSLSANNVYADSARLLRTSRNVHVNHDLELLAQSDYYNLGGNVHGNNVHVKAASIHNITHGSRGEQRLNPQLRALMGNAGMLSGERTFLEATQGNIENDGGAIVGTTYAQLVARGDILNLCNERTYRGRFDNQKAWDAALLQGGTGEGYDGVGLYMSANGHVTNDASTIASLGTNYIEANLGFTSTARSNTYIADHTEHKMRLGGYREYTRYSTEVQNANVASSHGENIIRANQGGIHSVGSNYLAQQGTKMSANGNIELYSLRYRDREYKFESKFGGLYENERKRRTEGAVPVVFAGNGVTRLHSSQGRVIGRGVMFVGGADLDIDGYKGVYLSADILAQDIDTKTRDIHANIGGINPASMSSDSFLHLDPTFRRFENFENANGAWDTTKDSWKLFRQFNNDYKALGTDDWGATLRERYGFGGSGGFDVSVGVAISETKTHTHTETKGPGSAQANNVRIHSAEGNVVLDRFDIDAENDVSIEAKGKIVQRSADLHNNSSSTSTTIGVSGSAKSAGEPTVSASYSHRSQSSTTHENAHIKAGGHMHLKANEIEFDGANAQAKSGDITAHKVTIKTKLNESESSEEAYSASTSGDVSAADHQHTEKKAAQRSGIHFEEGLNTPENPIKIDELETVSAGITTNGPNYLAPGKVTATELKEEDKTRGFSTAFNLPKAAEAMTHFNDHKAVRSSIDVSVQYKDGKSSFSGGADVPLDNREGYKQEVQEVKDKIKTAVHEVESAAQKVSAFFTAPHAPECAPAKPTLSQPAAAHHHKGHPVSAKSAHSPSSTARNLDTLSRTAAGLDLANDEDLMDTLAEADQVTRPQSESNHHKPHASSATTQAADRQEYLSRGRIAAIRGIPLSEIEGNAVQQAAYAEGYSEQSAYIMTSNGILDGMAIVDGVGIAKYLLEKGVQKLGIHSLFHHSPSAPHTVPSELSAGRERAHKLNSAYEKAEMNAPYDSKIDPWLLELKEDKTFVRVHSGGNKEGGWIMRPHEIEGLSPIEIRNKFSLPEIPTHFSDVVVPKGTYVRASRAAPIPEWGNGGGWQYQLLERLPSSNFKNTMPLPEPALETVRRLAR